MDDPRQALLFVGPERPLDRLWDAWLATPEADRRKFLERVRAAYLGAARKSVDTGGGEPKMGTLLNTRSNLCLQGRKPNPSTLAVTRGSERSPSRYS